MLSVLLAALWIGPAMSGSWYSPDRNGEGFTLQVLDNGTAHAIWFTYPPEGAAGQQAWIYASGGQIDGDRIVFENAITTRGPRFGAAYDPTQLQLIPWGRIEFQFTTCNAGNVTYTGPAAWGSGTRNVTRLSALAELECTGKRRVHASGARTLAGLGNRSGAWFDPAHNGEGWNVEELPDGSSQVYWFTYDANGEQAWTVGMSPTSGDSMTIEQNLRPVGTRFGTGFNASQVTLQPWGRLELQLTNCAGPGTASWQSSDTAFGSGTLRPQLLTLLAGTACLDGTPAVPQSPTWSQGATEPTPVSESANAIVGNSVYMAGGIPTTRAFKRYDADTNQWTVLPQTPAGRDHGLATTIGDSIYVTGGNHNGGGDHSANGWRYVIPENRWEAIPQLPGVKQAGAATLGGFAYFGDIFGNLVQFDPRTLKTRNIPAAAGPGMRDHSQLVAFQGELWMIGGRQPATGRVNIYDPASETWRLGPQLAVARAGFAAAATRELLFVAGGELLTPPFSVLTSVEAIAAGSSSWQAMPNLPVPTHGFGAIATANKFITVGGSTVAAEQINPGIVHILSW
ncbi:MAG TPA: kelch repeat-containing protein [Usitatibacter sp.]|nr:kelch repeat-containing protein [Usitatibacter sp.]